MKKKTKKKATKALLTMREAATRAEALSKLGMFPKITAATGGLYRVSAVSKLPKKKRAAPVAKKRKR
jgi:hypothetical protein